MIQTRLEVVLTRQGGLELRNGALAHGGVGLTVDRFFQGAHSECRDKILCFFHISLVIDTRITLLAPSFGVAISNDHICGTPWVPFHLCDFAVEEQAIGFVKNDFCGRVDRSVQDVGHHAFQQVGIRFFIGD
mmetsp:Transcript_59301/g.67132  ORF Transcript_59301/g.67132 Transcript_59301/m.67132 type:complete len:132 (-) Transcript_59301:866-1261(-)